MGRNIAAFFSKPKEICLGIYPETQQGIIVDDESGVSCKPRLLEYSPWKRFRCAGKGLVLCGIFVDILEYSLGYHKADHNIDRQG
jgi:hypothetical protein